MGLEIGVDVEGGWHPYFLIMWVREVVVEGRGHRRHRGP